MRHSQSPAMLRNARPHTRNEIRSAVRVRLSALFFARKSLKNREPPIWASGALPALGEGCYVARYSGLRKFNV
jgi:hypothetical protein